MALSNRLQAAFTTFGQENNIALAQANLHLSLVNIEGPAGYLGLWKAAVGKRDRAVDRGSLRDTAAVLGALFEDIVPDVPSLFKAYGERVSEIEKKEGKFPAIEPENSKTHGTLTRHVEETSIWAAASSGKAAVAVHLLGCMLARTCSPTEAVKIWEEILEGRKNELLDKDKTNSMPIKKATTARISLSHKHLVEWDSSVRAWLHVADSAKMKMHTQQLIILKNLSFSVNGDMDVYTGIVGAWKRAMTATDSLIDGNRRTVLCGAILLGISAWHFYPELILVGSRNFVGRPTRQIINPADGLVASGGYVSIVMQGHEPQYSRGIYWSLPLAHMRDYSDQNMSEKSTGSALSGISFEGLWRLL